MKEQLKTIFIRALDNIVGFKFLTFIMACVFLGIGKLSETLWVEVVFVVTGLRAATDIAQIIKSDPKQESMIEIRVPDEHKG